MYVTTNELSWQTISWRLLKSSCLIYSLNKNWGRVNIKWELNIENVFSFITEIQIIYKSVKGVSILQILKNKRFLHLLIISYLINRAVRLQKIKVALFSNLYGRREREREKPKIQPNQAVHSTCTNVQLSSLLDIHGSLRETRCSARLSRMYCCKVASRYRVAAPLFAGSAV